MNQVTKIGLIALVLIAVFLSGCLDRQSTKISTDIGIRSSDQGITAPITVANFTPYANYYYPDTSFRNPNYNSRRVLKEIVTPNGTIDFTVRGQGVEKAPRL